MHRIEKKMTLNLSFVRQQFSQCEIDQDLVFCSNAGGSYVCNQVNDISEHYNRQTRVQPYSNFSPSSDAGRAMDRAYQLWAEALGAELDEVTLGPSTSMNTYVLAQAMSAHLQPGDEIIVTNQDHEANSGVWRRMAESQGVAIREWRVQEGSGLLHVRDLQPLLNEATKWVFFTHCSNIVGAVNPVADIVQLIRAQSSARVLVDAVAYAPHHIPDVKALGVDAYVFSLYKVFGPHQGLLYLDRSARDVLQSQAHYFNRGQPLYDYQPAGPQHAQIAASAGVLDYFDALYENHFSLKAVSRRERLDAVHELIHQHELSLTQILLDYLTNNGRIRVVGKLNCADGDRAPTIAFRHEHIRSAALTASMQAQGIGTEHGNFYAHRLLSDMGMDCEDGVVRVSLVHYNSEEDAHKIISAIDKSLKQLS